MVLKANRRQFIQTSAAASMGYWGAGGVQAQESNSPNEQIAFASVGIGGKGSSDSGDAGNNGDMIAICDVDTSRLGGASGRFPKAKQYTDFRIMFEEMGDKIDAVTISTPDHCHTAAGLMAMRMGIHAFCQKPMTHSIYEARLMGDVAKEMGVATQMGNQGTANDGLRESAALIKAGALGTIQEVHIWTNRPVWPQGNDPAPTQAPPENLEWDLWLGPAKHRDFSPGNYHPFSWRGWWDFGTGALGDMACHTMNMPFAALGLGDPISVQAICSGHNKNSYPNWSKIDYKYEKSDSHPAMICTWYDGGQKPDPELLDGQSPANSGALVIGDKGKLYSPGDYGGSVNLLGCDKVEVEYEKSIGHFNEWVRAIKGGQPAMSNFPGYATPLTEMVLLGNLAVWAAPEGEGPEVMWDAKNMKATGAPDLDEIVKPTYRPGYILDV